MTLLLVLQSVLLVMAVAEIAAKDYPRIQQQLYVIAFLFTFVWCTAKYAYGPDIIIYIPYYRLTSGNLIYDLTHPIHHYSYEKGFVFLCSVCRWLGLSFWQFTAIISLIYFTTLGCLLRNLKKYKILALLVIVFLDSNLILVELRQCLAVSCFYVAIMAFNKKHYATATIFSLLMLTMHKTAFVILFFTLLFYLSRGLRIETKSYLLLGLLIFGLILIPLAPIMGTIIDFLPLPHSYVKSAKEHLLVGKSLQKVILLYLATIFTLAWYRQKTADNKARHWMIWCCMAVIVFLFPYWFLLNRFRSFFLPFIVMYVIDTITAEGTEQLPRQIYTCIVVGYIALMTILIPHFNKSLHYPTDRVSTVFERVNHSEEYIIERQMKQAIKYWEYDYSELLGNGLQ